MRSGADIGRSTRDPPEIRRIHPRDRTRPDPKVAAQVHGAPGLSRRRHQRRRTAPGFRRFGTGAVPFPRLASRCRLSEKEPHRLGPFAKRTLANASQLQIIAARTVDDAPPARGLPRHLGQTSPARPVSRSRHRRTAVRATATDGEEEGRDRLLVQSDQRQIDPEPSRHRAGLRRTGLGGVRGSRLPSAMRALRHVDPRRAPGKWRHARPLRRRHRRSLPGERAGLRARRRVSSGERFFRNARRPTRYRTGRRSDRASGPRGIRRPVRRSWSGCRAAGRSDRSDRARSRGSRCGLPRPSSPSRTCRARRSP